jgi:hypothetical protein
MTGDDRTEHLYCHRCSNEINGTPKAMVLGFRRYDCGDCGAVVTAPLATGRRLPWVAAALGGMAVGDVLLLLQFVLPGVLGLVVAAGGLVGLLLDQRLIRAHYARGRNLWLVHLARRATRLADGPATE